MWPNPQETADLVTFTEEILNGKLHFLCSVNKNKFMNILPISLTNSQRSLITLIFFNSITLKTQFTSKSTGSDIARKNFPITQTECVLCGYHSPEQPIWSKPWEVTWAYCYPTLFSWLNITQLTKISPFKGISCV